MSRAPGDVASRRTWAAILALFLLTIATTSGSCVAPDVAREPDHCRQAVVTGFRSGYRRPLAEGGYTYDDWRADMRSRGLDEFGDRDASLGEHGQLEMTR